MGQNLRVRARAGGNETVLDGWQASRVKRGIGMRTTRGASGHVTAGLVIAAATLLSAGGDADGDVIRGGPQQALATISQPSPGDERRDGGSLPESAAFWTVTLVPEQYDQGPAKEPCTGPSSGDAGRTYRFSLWDAATDNLLETFTQCVSEHGVGRVE